MEPLHTTDARQNRYLQQTWSAASDCGNTMIESEDPPPPIQSLGSIWPCRHGNDALPAGFAMLVVGVGFVAQLAIPLAGAKRGRG